MNTASQDKLHSLIEGCLKSPAAAQSDPVAGDQTPDLHEIARRSRSTKAAVLIPLIKRPGVTTVLLTVRTSHLYHHPGQISFPGGRVETGDTHPLDTALRETFEEVGIPGSLVGVLGYLDDYHSNSGFSITPVVGSLRPGFPLAPDNFEVAEIFEVPLKFFLDPVNHRKIAYKRSDNSLFYHLFVYKKFKIWGVTAAILINFRNKLRRSTQIIELLNN